MEDDYLFYWNGPISRDFCSFLRSVIYNYTPWKSYYLTRNVVFQPFIFWGKSLVLWSVYIQSEPRNTVTFHDTGCFIGILIMVYCNPHIPGQISSPIHPEQTGALFIAHISNITIAHNSSVGLGSASKLGYLACWYQTGLEPFGAVAVGLY